MKVLADFVRENKEFKSCITMCVVIVESFLFTYQKCSSYNLRVCWLNLGTDDVRSFNLRNILYFKCIVNLRLRDLRYCWSCYVKFTIFKALLRWLRRSMSIMFLSIFTNAFTPTLYKLITIDVYVWRDERFYYILHWNFLIQRYELK